MEGLQQLIQQHRKIEAALQESFNELTNVRKALDQSTIVAVTDRQGKITYVNDKFCEISQYTRAELIGQDHRIVNSGHHPKAFFKDMWETIGQGKIWRGEIKNRAKDGSYYWMATTIVPFLDKKDKPYQYVAIRHDVTERKRAEEEIRRFPQSIIRAQETEKERISRDIHDDLGQSLIALKMNLYAAFSDEAADIERLRKSYEEAMAYLDTIIERTRQIAHELRPASFHALGLAGSLHLLVEHFNKTRKLEVHFSEKDLDRAQFNGEAINLYRIVQEALANIVKHARASRVDMDIHTEGGRLLLRIEDNGKGFKQKRPGAGMGLLTMAERARILGGRLKIDSLPQKGTVLRVEVPAFFSEGKHA